MSRQIIYTAGPITAESMNRRWEYLMNGRTMAQKIWAAGHVAICPQMNTMFMDDPCIEPETFYKGDEFLIRRCVDGMVMLPGWEDSQGSKNELDLAFRLRLRVFYHDDDDELWEFLAAETSTPKNEGTT